MNVLHLISGGDSGGAKTHLFELLDKLKFKCNVSVGCLIPGPFYVEILEKDIETHLFEQRNRFDLRVVSQILEYIKKNKIDLLHVHGARANFIAAFLKRKLSIPIVTTIHSDYLLDFDEFVKKVVFTYLNVFSLKKLDYFIAVSDTFKDMLISRKFTPNSIYTVYNGMDFCKIPDIITTREEYGARHNLDMSEDLCYVGIAARFDVVKGVDVFIKGAAKAYKSNKNLRFLIAGSGAEEANLKALVKELGIAEAVKFLGFEKDIYGFLNFIDINTLTSLCESFPYSMLEGAAMKKPMVASRVGGIPSLVVDYETGFVFEPSSPDDLAEKLLMLASDKNLIKKMGDAIYERATTQFSADTFASTHMEIYNNILKTHYSKKKYDFVLSGYFGFNNSGDDALLKALISDLTLTSPGVRLAVLSRRPKSTMKLFKVDSVGRMNLVKVPYIMSKSKVLLSGGGSLIQDETSSKSLWYYLAIIKLAKKCGMKVMQIANGIGPVNRKFNRKLSAKVINNNVDRVTLREKKSAQEFVDMGIKLPYEVTVDPAVSLKGVSGNTLKRLLVENGIPDGDYVCVSIREWKQFAPGFRRILANALDYVYEHYNKNIVFLPMQYPVDFTISKSVISKMKHKAYIVEKPCDIDETIGIIGGSSLVIAMRLHALVYAVSSGVGVIALKYDPKIEGFMDYFSQSYIIDVEKLSEAELISVINGYFETSDKELNMSLCNEMKAKAKINAKYAIELLEKCDD